MSMATSSSLASSTAFELRYQYLFNEGRALAFPCDEGGHVDLDSLSDRARNNYFGARVLVGREYAAPVVLARRSQ